MSWIVPVAILIMFLSALGAYFFKKASAFSVHPLRIYKNYYFFIGAFFYGVSAFGYVTLLKFEDLLIIYPLASIQYIWVVLLSAWLLKEPITKGKVGGISLIVLGVIIMTVFR